jgi:hypothetical protein
MTLIYNPSKYDIGESADQRDYTDPEAFDKVERHLRYLIKKEHALMTLREASLHIPGLQLTPDAYWQVKSAWIETKYDRERVGRYFADIGRFYYSKQTDIWMYEQVEMTVRRPSLKQVWQRWRDVLAARKAFKDIPDERMADYWGNDSRALIGRRKINAQVTLERTEATYDLMLRAYEGRQPHSWQQMLDGIRVKAPKRRERIVGRVRSSPTGYKKTGKYETRPDGVRVPTVRKQ